MSDIADVEGVTPAYIRRMLKLAYLAPEVLHKILIARISPAVSLKDMSTAVELPWGTQAGVVFGLTT